MYPVINTDSMEDILNESKMEAGAEVKPEVKETKEEIKKKDLENSTTILVLGILSLVFCWCYGFVGFVLGIIAVAISGTPRRKYAEHPELYTESSYKNLNAGRICGIVGICISAFVVIAVIMAVMGVIALGLTGAACGL